MRVQVKISFEFLSFYTIILFVIVMEKLILRRKEKKILNIDNFLLARIQISSEKFLSWNKFYRFNQTEILINFNREDIIFFNLSTREWIRREK